MHTIWYDAIQEFNMNRKAECDLLNLACNHNQKYKKKKLKQMPVPTYSGPGSRSVKTVQKEPERLGRRICETDES